MPSASCRSSTYRSSPSYWRESALMPERDQTWGRARARGERLDLPS
ncbi:unnamed protein product [Ectocarpus sp. 6 AP-2014]